NDTLIMRHTRTLELVPMLATSWEPSADLMSWTFHLRQGVKFSHGKEFKAEDVKFSLDRLFEVDSPLAGVLDSIEETVIVDDYTVRFDLNTPNAFLPDLILRYHAQMTPSDVDPARFATETFGTGPYTLEEFVVGEFAVLKKRDDYFLEGLPYLDEIIFVYLPDPTTRAEALKAGTIDMIYALETENVPALEQHPDTWVSVATGAAYMNLAMNVTEPPFDNILVRKALQAATNRELILQASQFGLGGIAYDHPITLDDPVFNPSCKPPDYDPELAKSLLAQAGYPDGIELTLYTSSAGAAMVPMATAFQQSAKAAGIEITISVMPEDVYWSDGWMVKPFTTVWWGGRIPDEAFSIVYKSDAAWNESFYKNPEVDRLILKARGEPNLADRKVTYGELQCLLIDEVPRIIPVFRPLFIGLRNDVMDVEANWEDLLYLREGWLDR
ncbi:MAG: ABC transporter substrate-binding protein, partial [Chloroflexi bacterium]|nr:ABC transporter substrate-binding protein [Chloroflexota bacterium]